MASSKIGREFSIESLVSKDSGHVGSRATASSPPTVTTSSPSPTSRHHYVVKPEPHHLQHHQALNGMFPPVSGTSVSSPLPHPAFIGGSTTLAPSSPPNAMLHGLSPIHGLLPQGGALPGLAAAQMAAAAAAHEQSRIHGSPLLPPGLPAMPNPHQLASMFPNGLPNGGLAGLPNKDNFPLYTYLLARHSNYLNHGLAGM